MSGNGYPEPEKPDPKIKIFPIPDAVCASLLIIIHNVQELKSEDLVTNLLTEKSDTHWPQALCLSWAFDLSKCQEVSHRKASLTSSDEKEITHFPFPCLEGK